MNVTRRDFLVAVPAAGTLVALGPLLAARSSPQSPGGLETPLASAAVNEPVVSFHLDRPYLDLTGLETPYVPPSGLQSGAPLAALSEEEVFSRYYGFI